MNLDCGTWLSRLESGGSGSNSQVPHALWAKVLEVASIGDNGDVDFKRDFGLLVTSRLGQELTGTRMSESHRSMLISKALSHMYNSNISLIRIKPFVNNILIVNYSPNLVFDILLFICPNIERIVSAVQVTLRLSGPYR